MKLDDVIALAKAGYTSDQIGEMAKLATDDNQTLEPEKKPDPEPEKKPDPEPEKKQDPKPASANDDPTLKMILDLMQKQQIERTEQPKEQSTDEILALIINPE